MLIGSYRVLVIPLWAVAFVAIALSAPPGVMSSLIALIAIAATALAMPAIIRRLRPSHSQVEVLPALDDERGAVGINMTARTMIRTFDEVIDAQTMTADEADLLRMDNDRGRPIPQSHGEVSPVTKGLEHRHVYEDHVR